MDPKPRAIAGVIRLETAWVGERRGVPTVPREMRAPTGPRGQSRLSRWSFDRPCRGLWGLGELRQQPIAKTEGCGQLVSTSEYWSRVAVCLAIPVPTAFLVHSLSSLIERLFYKDDMRLRQARLRMFVGVPDVLIPSQLGPGFGHGLVVELEGFEVGLEGVGGGIKALGGPHQFD